MEGPSPLPLLRLLQVTDSSFPVGGYAYSHGLEWLVQSGAVSGESDLGDLLSVFVGQAVRRQWMPAASLAYRACSPDQIRRVDARFDASITAGAERAAGRAMGERLLQVVDATNAAPGLGESFTGAGPWQFAVVFGALGRNFGVVEMDMLGALGYSLVNSVTQATVRLGVIGADAAARLVSATLAAVARAAASVAREERQRIGAFAPGLELAAMLQPTLRFRMFAS